MAEELLIDINIKGEESLPKLDENLDKVVKTGKKTTNAMAELRKEIKDAKADMLKYAEGTDEYNNAMKRAAAGADRMTDINGKLKASQRDVGVVAKNVASSISGLAGGFAAAQGVVALFGVENEELTKTMVKLQAVLNVTQGLSNFVDTFDNMKDLWGAIKLRISETVAAKNADTIATNANTAAIEANNIANKSNVKSLNNTRTEVNNLSDSTKNLSNETALVSSNLTKTTNSSLADYSNMIKRVKEENILLNQVNKDYQKQLKKVSDINDPIEQQFIRIKKEQIEDNKELINQNNQHIQAISQLTKNQTTFVGTMIKSISVMAAYALAIGGAIYVITKLIEWINKIPEDIKLNVEIGSEAINQTKTLREETLKFQDDYAKAQKNNDYQQLKGLDDIAKKQYGLSQAQINTINHTADGWKTFFKEYIKLAEDTYYNEALIKKRVDLQMQMDVAKSTIELGVQEGQITERRYKALQAIAKKNGILNSLMAIGAEKPVLESLKNINEIEKKLKSLDKLQPKTSGNYFTNISETKDIKQTVTQNVQYGQFEMPDKKRLEEINKAFSEASKNIKVKNNFSLIGTDKDAEYELSKLKELYEKGKITTDEYLSKKYDILKFAEDRGIQLTETAYNTQAEIVERAEQRKREAIEKTIATIQASLDTSSMVTSALSELAQAEMDTINAKYDEKQNKAEQDYYNQVELINKSSASEDEKTKLLEDLDNQKLANEEKNEEERYKALKKNFELKKKLDIATAWINAASGIVSIWSHSTELGPIIGPIIAGVQSAAMLALTAAQTKSIMAQRMDTPVSTAASKSSSSSSTSTNVTLNNAKLNPTQTSLISKEENINKMNQQTYSAGVVKVSDINKVQNTVTVRNNNTSY